MKKSCHQRRRRNNINVCVHVYFVLSFSKKKQKQKTDNKRLLFSIKAYGQISLGNTEY